MKYLITRSSIDILLLFLLALLTLATILFSAAGGEPVAVLLFAVVMGSAALFVGYGFGMHRFAARRTAWPAIAVSLACFAIILSVGVTDWPLKTAYACSHDALDALAQRTRDGENIVTPVRAGLFTVRRVEKMPCGTICLWTNLEASGNTGFAECRPDDLDQSLNLWSYVRLDDCWQYISED